MAVWNVETEKWDINMIGGDCEFKPGPRQIAFTTTHFQPIAMLQSRCTDYPYKHWKLRCIENEKAILDLQTRRDLKLIFEIGPLYLRLINSEKSGADLKHPELAHLEGKEFHPGYLLAELSKCGIHLMPRDQDAKLAGIELKNKACEERAIIDVATSIRAFHFRRAEQNQGSTEKLGIPDDQIVLKIRENLEFDEEFLEDYEPDWRYVSWWHNKCSFVQGCGDTDETCKLVIAEGQETHALLTQAIAPPICSDEAYLKSQDVSPIEFIDTVKKTLRLLRLLSFS